MRIAVLSDTHIPEAADDMPACVYADLKKSDMIFHVGDITSPDFLKKLQKIAEVRAVCGNMDEPGLSSILPVRALIEVCGFTIGLIHGYGTAACLLENVSKEFAREKKIDAVIFGHSHKALLLRRDGKLFFNPGSPTDKVFSDFNSYGIITIGDKIEAEIVRIE